MTTLKSILVSTMTLFVVSNPGWSATHFTVNASTTALWSFASRSSGSIPDLGPNGLSLSNANSFSLVSSPTDSAVSFTGSQGANGLSHTNTSLLNISGTGKMTLEGRIYLTQYPTGTVGYTVVGSYDGLSVTIGAGGFLSIGRQKISGGTGYWVWFISANGVVPLNRWVDVATSFDNSTGQAYGYIDESPVQLYTHSGYPAPNTDSWRTATSNFEVGATPTDGHPFNGLIDEVRVSNNLVYGAGLPLNASTPPTVQTPPTNLVYSLNPATYYVGAAITTNTPTINGTTPITYSVTPALPAGLTLNTGTGAITGTPTVTSPPASYVVIATNTLGSTTATLNITVTTAPTFVYSSNPAQYVVGTVITPNTPTVNGTITGYSVSPALPAGLTLNTTTGVISGTPTTPASTASYTVTASGGATTTLVITVRLPPSGLSYSSSSALYIVGTTITPNTPSISGSATITYVVSPSLPAGLTLSTSTGIITGKPTTPSAAANYTITATNQAGSTTATLTLAVINPVGILQQSDASSFTLKIPGSASIVFVMPKGSMSNGRLEIIDMKGMKIWGSRTELANRENTLAWNGVTTNGLRPASGLYLVRLTGFDLDGKQAGIVTRRMVYSP